MKNKIFVVVILIVVLISAGCGLRKEPVVGEIIYHEGKEGLEVNIIKNLPPEEVWKENEFIIGLELRNKGAYNIEDGVVKISGFDPRYIESEEDEQTIEFLAGKSPGYPEGDYMIMKFDEKNIDIPKGAGEYEAAFTVNVEYDYKTEANTVVCVSPKIFSIVNTRDVCEVKPVSMPKGQGAPVAITHIEESITPLDRDLRVEFIFYIANKGKGEVKGNVDIENVKLSEQLMECDTKQFALKGKDEKKIHCSTIVERGISARQVPLSADLSYRYGITLDKKIKILGFVS